MKILLYTSGSLGDILVLFPIMAGIRTRYPDARITLLNKHKPTSAVSPIDLVLHAGFADEIKCVSKSALRLWRLSSLIPYPGRRRYDLVFYLQRDGRTLAGKIAREKGFFERISRRPVRGALELVPVPGEDGAFPRIGELMLARIGGKGTSSHWPLAKYAAALKEIVSTTRGVPVFLGGAQDRTAIRTLMKELPAGRAFYAEAASNDLLLSLAVMSKLKFYLGNDTGSIHMAAAAGLRCVGIYCSHDQAGLWRPLGDGHQILRCTPEPECAGCRKADCPFGTPSRCIDAIPVGAVVAAASEMLAAE